MVLNGHQLLLAWPFEEAHFFRFTPGPCIPGSFGFYFYRPESSVVPKYQILLFR